MKGIQWHWYQKRLTWLTCLLLPLSWLYRLIAFLRKYWLLKQYNQAFTVPVIVVGNINIGGVGKSPLVCAMVTHLEAHGYSPGVVSRGYGGKGNYPLVVNDQTPVGQAGDEPKMLYEQTGVPFVVDPDRRDAVDCLLERFPEVDVVLSDDGLQHYKLYRDIEVVVTESERLFGNQQVIPAGPLREPVCRLKTVDFLVSNGQKKSGYYQMRLQPDKVVQLNQHNETYSLEWLQNKTVHAVSGIGNPKRFFDTLSALGAKVIEHPFNDHYFFKPADIMFEDERPVIMTHKDAVKCNSFSDDNLYYLSITAKVETSFLQALVNKLQS